MSFSSSKFLEQKVRHMESKFKYFLDGILFPFKCLIELFDFSGRKSYNSPETDKEAFQRDSENLRRDWEIIGRDFEAIIGKVEKDHEQIK